LRAQVLDDGTKVVEDRTDLIRDREHHVRPAPRALDEWIRTTDDRGHALFDERTDVLGQLLCHVLEPRGVELSGLVLCGRLDRRRRLGLCFH
jgi:hypothetical protein